MKIAIPLTQTNELSTHFGASQLAGIFEVDPQNKRIVSARAVVPPESEPCCWADWLKEEGVELLIAGGIGRGALQRLANAEVSVLVGAPVLKPATLVQAWLDGALTAGMNNCEGGHDHHHQHGEHGHKHAHGGCGCSH